MKTDPAAKRYMELPRMLRIVSGRPQLLVALERIAGEVGVDALCFVSGPSTTRELAVEILADRDRAGDVHLVVRGDRHTDVDELAASPEFLAADLVVAVGGGRTIDVAKRACAGVDTPVVVVPTQLSADGISSPISVLRSSQGATESLRSRLPIAVLADLDTIAQSPVGSARAGLGDLLANSSALHDWRLAETAGRDTVDDFAALLSQAAADLVHAIEVEALGAGRLDRDFAARLLEGLVLSGLAMEIAGSSRPCSGSEHLFSHALDRAQPGTALHGEQVAFASLLSANLQGRDWRALRELLLAAGMSNAVAGFGLPSDQIVAVLREAPATRPDRYTVLDESSEADFERAAQEVLAG